MMMTMKMMLMITIDGDCVGKKMVICDDDGLADNNDDNNINDY